MAEVRRRKADSEADDAAATAAASSAADSSDHVSLFPSPIRPK